MPAATSSRACRRRQRSVRLTVAATLLVLAGVVLVGSLMLGSTAALVTAALVSYAAGVAAARIVANELARSRHDAARVQAEQAHAYAGLTRARVAEHEERVAELAAAQTEALAAALTESDTVAATLRTQLALAQERAADSSRRFFRESRRTAALQATVATLRHELAEREAARDDMLATWDGTVTEEMAADTAAVVDLLAWEQRSAGAGELPRRKHA